MYEHGAARGSGTSGASPVTALAPLDIDAFDELVTRLFASLELNATLDAVVEVLLAHAAGRVSLVIEDERGVAFARSAGERLPGSAELAFALGTEDRPFGTVRVALPAGVWDDARAAIARIVPHAARALANARRFDRERNVALTFQNAALVPELPSFGAYSFDAIYEAGRAEALVGGDWYDAFELRDGRIVVSIGDVVGSGLGAAIAMVNVRQVIRGVAQVHPDPALMLEAADLTLRSQHPERYVTAFAGVIDPIMQQCTYANAGHPAPYIRLPNDALVQVAGRGIPIGLGIDDPIEVHHVALPPGSLFVLYTDGLTESSKDVIEGTERLERALRETDMTSKRNIARSLHDEVLGSHSRDDVAILVVRAGLAEPVRRWRFDPAWAELSGRVRGELCAELVACGVERDRLIDVEVIFAELMANLVRHAPGTAEITFERHGARLVVHVLDKGPGFEFSPRLPSDLFSQSGRGLFLIGQLAREFSVERRPGGGSHARVVLDLLCTSGGNP